MTRPKHTLLLLLTYLAIPVSLLLIEIGLRLWAPDLENPIVRPVSYDGVAWYEVNRGYLRKYFPRGTPLIQEFKPALFRREKVPGMLRIFCLGGSSMFGTPYQMTANIPGILRKQLRYAYPGTEIEVVNFGASAINSNVILDLSRELVRYRPDLVVLYMGHNEFYGPDGVGAGLIEGVFPASIQWKYRLRESRLVAWLLRFFEREGAPGERNLMLEVSKGGAVPLASETADRIFALWEKNLSSILEVWRSRGIPVLVSDVSSNLMFPPFLYDTLALQTTALRGLQSSGGRFAGDPDSLRRMLDQLHGRDSTNAFTEYWLGRMALLRGDSAAARSLLERARDFDLLKFRAPRRINEVTRDMCRRMGIPCVSTDSLFASLSVGGIPGDTLFWEHLHPTFRGYYEIATLLAREITRGKLVRVPHGEAPPPLPFVVDSLSICWLDRAYGDLSIQHLTGRWPFTNYRRVPDVLDSAVPGQLAVAKAVYDRKVVWDQGCYQSASLFWKNGDLRAAATTYEALLEEYPRNYYPRYLLGNLLGKMGDKKGAMENLRLSIASNPAYPQARLDLGLLLINDGRFDEAIGELMEASRLPAAQKSRPLLSGIHYGLGAAYANKRDVKGAVTELEEALRLDAGNADAWRMLESLKRMR